MARKLKSEMMAKECPHCSIGHRCCQLCKGDNCVHYVDATLPSDAEDYGACLLWIDPKGMV